MKRSDAAKQTLEDSRDFARGNEEAALPDELKTLIEKSKSVKMTPDEQERQRRSFAYGNTQIENPRITRETVDREAEGLQRKRA